MTNAALTSRAPVKLKNFALPVSAQWRRFNQFCRPVQAPALSLRPMSGDADTAIVALAGKTVGTLNRRPHDWFLITAMTGERATLAACDIEGVFIRLVINGDTLGEAIRYVVERDEFDLGL